MIILNLDQMRASLYSCFCYIECHHYMITSEYGFSELTVSIGFQLNCLCTTIKATPSSFLSIIFKLHGKEFKKKPNYTYVHTYMYIFKTKEM